MKRTCAPIAAIALLALLGSLPSAAQGPQVRIIVHADNPVSEISSKELGKIFLGKSKLWETWREHGESIRIQPVDQAAKSELRNTFSNDVLGSDTNRIRSYWHRQVFSGQGVPPEEMSSDEEVLDFVRLNPGAIGYVWAATPLWEGIRSLVISDRETAGDEYPPTDDVRHVRRDQVVDRRGEVQVVLTGSCGPGGEGRTAILRHRDRYGYVQVGVETSRWHDGRRQASHQQAHTLGGDEEVRLGCTRAGATELRYALVDSSDNSVQVKAVRAHRAPSRDFIVLTESGTCGHGGQGRFITAVNQHPERSIYVMLESVRRLDGRLQNRSMSSFRLEPGGERKLGCSLDGALEKQYSVLEAK